MIAPLGSRIPRTLLSIVLLAGACPALAAWPHSADVYTPIAPSTGNQVVAQVLPDGIGGAFVLFTDTRGGTEDVYVQRLTSTGNLSPGWPTSGLQVAAIAGQKLAPQMTNDASDGVIVVWVDRRTGVGDIYAQHVLGNGALAGGSWPGTGLAVYNPGSEERRPQICSDGTGGAWITWERPFSNTDTDVYAAHLTGGGTMPFRNVIDNSLHDSRQITMASDGAGGYFVAYQDSSSLFLGCQRIFGIHGNASGTLVYGPANFVSEGSGYRDINPKIVADGSGGLQVAWQNNQTHSSYDLAMRRYSSNLTPGASGFGTSWGLDTPDYNVIADGTGGMILSWQERLGHAMVNRVSAGGFILGWPVDLGDIGFTAPVPLAPDRSGGAITAFGNGYLTAQRLPVNGGSVARWGSGIVLSPTGTWSTAAASDGLHGAIIAWTNATPAFNLQVYAQRIDGFGALGNAEPAITSIKDVAGDQGGHVRIAWNGSYLDSDPYFDVGSYYVWRQTPATLAAAAIQRGAKFVDDAPTLETNGGTRFFRHAASPAYAWEFVSSQPANGSAQYSYVAPTSRDSLPTTNPRTAYMIEARWSGGDAFWDSAPDSGYSVDNLAPAAPAQLAAQWFSGTSVLHWMPNTEGDLYGYRVYRGTTSNFTPSPGNRIASPPDTGYVDAAGAAYWYKVSAVDIHGNESPFATVLPQGVNGVPPGEPAPRLVLAVASRNPGHDAMLRVDLTHGGPVRLDLYDASGRFVTEVAHGQFPAGSTYREWDGRTEHGELAPSGIYFARLTAEGRSLVQRVVRIR